MGKTIGTRRTFDAKVAVVGSSTDRGTALDDLKSDTRDSVKAQKEFAGTEFFRRRACLRKDSKKLDVVGNFLYTLYDQRD